MTEKIVSFFINILGGIKAFPFGRELIAFFLSMLPIIELRGGIIAGRALGLDPIPTFIICYIGNILPVPFILWLIKRIMDSMRKSSKKALNKFVNWLDRKVEKKKEPLKSTVS